MRTVGIVEKKKRGCIYCLDYKTVKGQKKCKHDECPYHELDGFECYTDYMKSKQPLWIEFLEELRRTK